MNGKTLNNNNGQVLLLLVLVIGTLVVVAMTAIFQSTSTTQRGGVEQQSQITLAAAEAAIEKALQSGQEGTFESLGLTNLSGISLENSSVSISENRTYTFVSPKIEKDQQYTFYLAEYTGNYPAYFGSSYNIPFYIHYESGNELCGDVALELTFVYDQTDDANSGGTYEMAKYIVDPENQITNDDSKDLGDPDNPAFADAQINTEHELDGTTFNCRTSLIDPTGFGLPNIKLLLTQAYFRDTKLGFAVEQYELLDEDTNPEDQLPPQGKTVTATARANITAPTVTTAPGGNTPTPYPNLTPQTGLTRTAQVFQSYPQIPSEFWVTIF